MDAMGWQGWFTIGRVIAVLALLVKTRLAPDIVLVSAVGLLFIVGILDANETLAGLANEGMVTIGFLFVVGAGVVETGGIGWLAEQLFGRPKTATRAVIRMMVPTSFLSAFMNNTPLVAMLIPAVSDWGKKLGIPASKLMIPLSYAAILGGTCTLIGTSTNLVVNGLVIKTAREEVQRTGNSTLPTDGLRMFDVTWIGIPCVLVGCTFVVIAGRWLLPDRRPALSQLEDPRQYTIEMMVAQDSPLVGKTIENAGLRHLEGVYLAEIDREDVILPAVSPREHLRAGDRLVFVGVVESMVDLQKVRGLTPATDQVFKLSSPRAARTLIEAVVSNTCPVVDRTIRDGKFRTAYNAVVLAVARNGERINKKIGDIVLRPGDTLLLEAHPSFVDQQRNSRDFFLVSQLEGSTTRRHDRAVVALTILAAMVVVVTLGDMLGEVSLLGLDLGKITMLKASMVAAGLMVATRCCTARMARRSIDWQTLMAIAASFGIGMALEKTGAARGVAEGIVDLAQGSPWMTLALVYLVTALTTEMITNNAAAALMFPLALSAARNLNVGEMPFIIAVAMAASAAFATPIGYQTNLMVYGPGGYRFGDYFKIGLPLNLLMASVTVAIAPFVYVPASEWARWLPG